MSIERLPSFALHSDGPLGQRFAAPGLDDYREAARHVRDLPYGRNSDRSNWQLILKEERGTCSTKHALLARENGRHVALVLGVYEMDRANTPAVGPVLKEHGLRCVPETHCYLTHEGARVDLTRESEGTEQVKCFLHEEEIEPHQIGEYKVVVHREIIRQWVGRRGLDPESVWRAREECLAALAE